MDGDDLIIAMLGSEQGTCFHCLSHLRRGLHLLIWYGTVLCGGMGLQYVKRGIGGVGHDSIIFP